MSEIRDTLFRYLAMLQPIPRSPGRISTPVLLEKLNERGVRIDARSLQRDLRERFFTRRTPTDAVGTGRHGDG